jgi:hypothetical protein
MQWRRPATLPTSRERIVLRVAAATIATISVFAGVLFAIATFSEGDPWGQWVTACLSFGLFGFPGSLIAIVAGAIVAKAGAAQGTAESACAVFLAITYFAQWLLISAGLFRRSMW